MHFTYLLFVDSNAQQTFMSHTHTAELEYILGPLLKN